MTELSIIIAPDPRLKQQAQPVAAVDSAIRRLMDDMLAAMHRANGIGLAAPQVGVLKQVIVIDVSMPDQPALPVKMANPEILWRSEERVRGDEGCLSLPEQFAEVTRPKAIRVRFLDEDDRLQELEADGLLAKCIQHEVDHLDGVLFVDHISQLKRSIILRRLSKQKKAVAAE